MQITIKGHVYADHCSRTSGHTFHIYSCKLDSLGLYVGPIKVTYDVPADWNPVADEIAKLQAQKKQALEDFQRTVAQINERLSKLQAIEVAA